MRWWCPAISLLAIGGLTTACGGAEPSLVERCVRAQRGNLSSTAELCERAWRETADVAAAVAGAHDALVRGDAAALRTWTERAPATVEGARILHYQGELQVQRGDLAGAEATLRRAIALRVDADPARAANTALVLLALVQSHRPAEESVVLARTAWQQAEASGHPMMRAMASAALTEILVDLGELRTAEMIIERMVVDDSPVLHDIAEGRVQAARGRRELAAALFARASEVAPSATEASWRLNATLELIRVLVQLGRLAEAREHLAHAHALVASGGALPIDAAGRLAYADAAVALADGRIDDALQVTAQALHAPSRDGARILLATLRGDALARRGDAMAAEQAWRDAANIVESWRASIPNVHLRNKLVEHQRHAIEAWFESAAHRGDVGVALDLVSRLFGRALAERTTAVAVDGPPSIDRVVARLAAADAVAPAAAPAALDLATTPHALAILVATEREIWALRRDTRRWSLTAVGTRDAVLALVDAYRRDVTDRDVATRLGEALFPAATLPRRGPLVVLLDRPLADLAVSGLRTGGRYIVEHAPIVELLAPDLLRPAPARAWTDAVVLGDPRGDLPGAAREVTEVAALLAVPPSLGRAATRDVVAGARHARILHIATHSAIEDGGGRLVLHGEALSSLELLRLAIAPRLAVVATCRSQTNADPTASIVAALLASGAVGVVGAKRSVDDDASRALILDFYRAGGARDPIVGLAAAQRAAIHAGRSPRDWASFSFFGTGGALESTKGEP